MRKFVLICVSLCTAILLFSASPVMAQQWVGPNGSDANSCTQTAPCATFQGALNKFPGQVLQINCLASGSYGSFTITSSIVVDCGAGNIGNIVSSIANGITINTTAKSTIILRHLAFNGLGNVNYWGIITSQFAGGGTLIVEDCMIYGYSGNTGIIFTPNGGRGLLQVSNSEIFGNDAGIGVTAVSSIASVTLNHVEIVGNAGFGLAVAGDVVVGTMRDSLISSHGGDGIYAGANQVFFTVEESSIIANLTNGIHTVSAGAAIKVGASTIGGNGTGVRADAGSIVSFGNNQVSDNGSDGSFTSAKALK
jgi:hypothetical protein